jgi:hypothetical protein
MEHFVDISLLEPPEPLEEALAAAMTLNRGDYLRIFHRRYPCLLEQRLALIGCRCLLWPDGEGESTTAVVWIDGDPVGEAAARSVATPLAER